MKYLKSYETYKEIDCFEYQSATLIEFTDKHRLFLVIKRAFPNLEVEEFTNSISVRSLRGHNTRIIINELRDEYFVIRKYPYRNDSNKYYLCDQVHGLLDCIKKTFI